MSKKTLAEVAPNIAAAVSKKKLTDDLVKAERKPKSEPKITKAKTAALYDDLRVILAGQPYPVGYHLMGDIELAQKHGITVSQVKGIRAEVQAARAWLTTPDEPEAAELARG